MPYEHIPPGLRARQPMIRHIQPTNRFAWSPDGRYLAVPSNSQAIGIWDTSTAQRVQTLMGHVGVVYNVAWSPDGTTLASVAADGTVRLWHPLENRTVRILRGHTRAVYAVAWLANGSLLASGSADGIIHLWNPQTGALVSTLRSESAEAVYALAWSPVETVLASGSAQEILLWDGEATTPLCKLVQQAPFTTGNVSQIYSLAWSSDGRLLASGSADCTIRLWEPESERLIRILEGHTGVVTSISFSCDDRLLASKARDKTICIWRTDTWKPVAKMKERSLRLPWSSSLAFHPHASTLAIAEDEDRKIGLWDMDVDAMLAASQEVSMYYTNAKIALVGDSGVGKSSLGQVLVGQPFAPVASTHGRKVWLFDAQEVGIDGERRETRETLLWDLAGQPGYRLIHQLHLSEVSVALIVFDSYSETDPFAGVHHWVRALDVAHRVQGMGKQPMTKFLIAARIDRRGRGVSRARIEALKRELHIDRDFEVSAKEGAGIEELIQAIKETIVWDQLPKVTSTDLFQSIKTFLADQREAGRILATVDELYRMFLRSEGVLRETEELRAQFRTCIGLVEAKDLIRRLSFGDYVLLQPEKLDAYASALINAAKDEPDELGSILEEKVKAGNFPIPSDERLQDAVQEELLLIAMTEDLMRYEIALREPGDDGSYLVFPFQSTRENADLPDLERRDGAVIFSFEGPLLNIYATLAVRLSHSGLFIKKELWKNAITYTTQIGGTYGLVLQITGEGRADLVLFFDDGATQETFSHFENFVAAHLKRRVLPDTIGRRKIFVCPRCRTPVTEIQVERRRLRGFTWLLCSVCDETISLADQQGQEHAQVSPSSSSSSMLQKLEQAADKGRADNVALAQLQGKIKSHDHDIFFCYNRQDESAVKLIGEQLKLQGYLPWMDVWELQPGERWLDTIEEQIQKINVAAVFVGKHGFSTWQRDEMRIIRFLSGEKGCKAIPVILSDVSQEPLKLPVFLQSRTWVDFRQGKENTLQRLIEGIQGEERDIEFPTP